MIKLKNITLKNKVCLAPMADMNIATFRYFCKKYRCGLIYSPMIHVDNLINNKKQIIKEMSFNKYEKPIAIQLVGHDKDSFIKAIKIIEPYADIIDINFGCPDTNIVKSKSGAYFLNHLNEMDKLLSAITSSTNKPISVKIRLGFDKIDTKNIIKTINKHKVYAIAIHARTAKELYSGAPHYDEIKKSKELTDKIIITNGDIDENNCKEILAKTKADMLMIGRKAIGQPEIFRKINSVLSRRKYTQINKLKLLKDFLKKYSKLEKSPKLFRLQQQLSSMTKGLQNSAMLRDSIARCKNFDEIKEIINKL